jgi:hypothetical protein
MLKGFTPARRDHSDRSPASPLHIFHDALLLDLSGVDAAIRIDRNSLSPCRVLALLIECGIGDERHHVAIRCTANTDTTRPARMMAVACGIARLGIARVENVVPIDTDAARPPELC